MRDPWSKGSLSGIRSGWMGHHHSWCGRGLVASPGWAQRAGHRARWWDRNWGVGRNRGPSRARRGSKETESSGTRTNRGRSSPGRSDGVRPVALGDGHGGRGRVENVSWGGSISGWARGNNELRGRGCGRYRGCGRREERWGGPLGCIQSHWVRNTTPIQTVDNIDETMIGKTHLATNSYKIEMIKSKSKNNKWQWFPITWYQLNINKAHFSSRSAVAYLEPWYVSECELMSQGTCLDRELAPKDPALGPMGLPPWLEGCTNVRRWSGDLAAAIGWEVAVKLAKGLWTRDWVDIIKTSIRIWPIRSLKSEYTTGEGQNNNSQIMKCSSLWWLR